jgi:hypothetical protein
MQVNLHERKHIMSARHSSSVRRAVILNAAACVLGFSVWAVHAQDRAVSPETPQQQIATMSAGDLQRAFWTCDYAATTRGVHATPVELCAAIMEELKQSKFGGSFEDLLAWWRLHKAAEHDALTAAAMHRNRSE